MAWQIVGALWYLLAIERKGACWDEACRESGNCNPNFLYCSDGVSNMTEWINNSKTILDPKCAVTDDETPQFKYGIYAQALSSGILGSQHFVSKYFYCLWWGLQNLRSDISFISLNSLQCSALDFWFTIHYLDWMNEIHFRNLLALRP